MVDRSKPTSRQAFWKCEQGPEYKIGKILLRSLETWGFKDESDRDVECPRFVREVPPFNLILTVEHPDPFKRATARERYDLFIEVGDATFSLCRSEAAVDITSMLAEIMSAHGSVS